MNAQSGKPARIVKRRIRALDGVHPVDAHIGARLRLRRTLLGLSQEKVAEAIGLTFQQLQKYERGANRISGSRLYDLSRVLDVPVSFFFDDMSDEVRMSATAAEPIGEASRISGEPPTTRQALELMRAFQAIDDEKLQTAIYQMVKAVSRSVDRAELPI